MEVAEGNTQTANPKLASTLGKALEVVYLSRSSRKMQNMTRTGLQGVPS
jgi:hypothetical protein